MTEHRNPTHEEVRDRLLAEDPELREVYEASEPAYLVAREVIRTRGELGISQAELARRMGTSQSVVSRLENMEGSPNLKTVLALAKAMGRRVDLRFADPTAAAEEISTEVMYRVMETVRNLSGHMESAAKVLGFAVQEPVGASKYPRVKDLVEALEESVQQQRTIVYEQDDVPEEPAAAERMQSA